MDCRNALESLDGSRGMDSPEADPRAREHVSQCSECQSQLALRELFDSRLRGALLEVPIPPALESRILAHLEEQESACDDVSIAPPSSDGKRRPYRWMVTGVMAASLAFVAIFYSLSNHQTRPLAYAAASQQLTQRFLRYNEQAWNSLPAFSAKTAEFDLTGLDRALSRLELSDPRGVDLGGTEAPDAAAFRFSHGPWQGTIIAMPITRFSGIPADTLPRQDSGRNSFHWRSPDGKLAYLCFVQQGDANALVQDLFGRMA